jgi:imidazolonepropionase-like amidohydrolase
MHGLLSFDLAKLVEFGLSPKEALRAATSGGAACCRVDDRVGTLQPGKLADIIAIDGDPLTDITAMGQVAFVMKGGKRFDLSDE